MSRVGFLIFLSIYLIAAGSAAQSTEREPADLLTEGTLRIDSRLIPDTGIVPGQKLVLELEVATIRWFAGGTRISVPEVPGLVILQTESFASNASEQRNGESWVVQRWAVDVYPQREGEFTVPAITLNVQVNDAQSGNIGGQVKAPAVRFAANIPPELEQAKQWVAAPQFQVEQTFDRDLEALSVGDAVERVIRFEANDVMAMMLPSFEAQPMQGLKAYPLPPELQDSNNRGEMVASRVERISYIAQQPGSYSLPAEEFLWWDTRNRRLILLSLPAVDIEVTGTATNAANDGPSAIWFALIILATGLLIILLALWLSRSWLRRLPWEVVLQPIEKAMKVLRSLRQPALPARLNPDSSAGE